jgi:hypothetical protein
MGAAPTSRSHGLGVAAFVVCLVAGPAWLLARSFAPAADPPPIDAASAIVLAAAVDVTATRGCIGGDLPGFTVPRWITAQSGFARTDGAAYLQCQINRWVDEPAAVADFDRRVELLDGVVAYTADRAPGRRTERIATVEDGSEVRSYAERSPVAATALTWITVVRHGRYAGVVTLHSYVDPAPVDRTAFEGLVATVRHRMAG